MRRIIHLSLISLIAALALSCSGKKAEEGATISSMEDLRGRTVAVLGGSVQDLLLSAKCPDCTILRSETDADVYTMVQTGKADAMIGSSLSWIMAKSAYSNLVAVGDTINPIPIAFAFSKKNSELREEFNAFLNAYLTENDINVLIDEWTDAESTRQMPDSEKEGGPNGTCHFAVSAITPPFGFIKNGQVSGIEPEILARFAISRGMKWDFADVAFSGLISYIQTGKADVGCSIICVTEERKQSVDFSTPWSAEASVIIVNKKFAPAELAGESTIDKEPFFQSIKNSLEKSLIKEDRYLMLLNGLKTTILISILAAIFGTLLGMLLCFTSMRRNKLISSISNIFIEFMRCMPQVVFLMLMFYVVFGKSNINGIWVAIIAFSLCFGAYTSVIFRSSVQSIDKGQNEAALSMGFSKFKAFTNVILPQTIQRALPVYKGEFIGLVKATSIVGYIAVFDLTKAGDIIRSRTYEAFFPLILVTIVYFLVIWVLTIFLKYIEAKTQPQRKKFFK